MAGTIVSSASFVLVDNIKQKNPLDIEAMLSDNGVQLDYSLYDNLSRVYNIQVILRGETKKDIIKKQRKIVGTINGQNRLRYLVGFDLKGKLTFSTYDFETDQYTYELYEVETI